MTTLRLLPLVAVCAAACTTLAQAAPSQSDLERVRLYGDVSIAQDSVNSWGVWEQFEPPAAGPATPTVALTTRGDLYRPLGTVTTITPVTPTPPVAASLCASGALCGFGVFYSTTVQADPSAPTFAPVVALPGAVAPTKPLVMASTLQPERFTFVTRPDTVELPTNLEKLARLQPQAVSIGTWEPNAIRMRNEVLNGGSLVTDTGNMYQDGGYYGYDGGNFYLSSSRSRADNGTGVTAQAEVARMVGLFEYISGDGPKMSQRFLGYWGVTTSAGGMAELQGGKVVMNYKGVTAGLGDAGVQNVSMTIDFGQGKITEGKFGTGVDGYVSRSTTPSGTTQLSGQVGFTFTGDVSGSTFRATNLQAADATSIRGTVQGAFFGSGAQVAAGVADVVKTKAGEGAYTNGKYTDAFITYKDGFKMSAPK